MNDIVISEFMDEDAVDWLCRDFGVTYDPSLVDDAARLQTACAGARALIVRNRTQVSAALITACPDLIAVGRLGVGLDNIDLDACKARKVAVFPATGGNTVSVAEYVITAVLMLRRTAWLGSAEVLSGAWPRQRMMGLEVSGATLGLIGFGAIAQAVAARARALGMSITAHDPFLPDNHVAWATVQRCESLDTLLQTADAVSLHVPLTKATRNLLDAARLKRMKRGAVLVNTARGGIINEAALAEALESGHLKGAALDVFEAEPLPDQTVLKTAPNLIATPHIAGVTVDSNTRISWITAENVARCLQG